MIFRNEITVHKGIIPESSGFHSGTLKITFFPNVTLRQKYPVLQNPGPWRQKHCVPSELAVTAYTVRSRHNAEERSMDFYIWVSVHHKSIIYNIINQQETFLAVLCLLKTTSMLYMFRTPFAFIFRSTINCNTFCHILAMEY